MKNPLLIRFWFASESGLGVGVTTYDFADAMQADVDNRAGVWEYHKQYRIEQSEPAGKRQSDRARYALRAGA